ncbi:MAG: oligosaccharide flippase family protein, partial [Sedimentisphaerales bacterium]|nr:oligosaccharide flippase family protein [Sedimentisphaerales bacterium]
GSGSATGPAGVLTISNTPTSTDTPMKPSLLTGILAYARGRLAGDGLAARCMRGSIMLSVGAFISRILAFASKMLLTRLLLPQEMGLAVMILSLSELLEALTEVGIKQSVIQHKDGAGAAYMNMAWWFQAVRGIGLYAVAFVAAPSICGFYFQDKAEVLGRYSGMELAWLLRVSFLIMLFRGLGSPRAHVLEKTFHFGKAAAILQGGAILGVVTTVILAILLRNVWAIALGSVFASFFACLLSYVLCPFVPTLAYDRDSFRSLCSFARGMLGLPVLTYIAFNTDLLVTGKLLAASAVGYYGMARVLAQTPRDLFTQIVSPVMLPAIAERQEDSQALRQIILRLTTVIAVLVMPLLAFSILCSRPILRLAFGPEYASVATPFGFFCVQNVLLIHSTVLAALFFGTGRPEKHRMFVGVRAAILVALIYPATRSYGLTGAAAAVAIACCVSLTFQILVVGRMVRLSVSDYMAAWLPGSALAVLPLIVVESVKLARPEWEWVHLVLGGSLCMIATCAGLRILTRTSRFIPA